MTSSLGNEPKETILSPEVRRIRNSIIKKFADEPLDIMAKFVKDVVDNEEDTVKRLGAMAARVEILRMRIAQISEVERPSVLEETTEEVIEEEHMLEDDKKEIIITNPNLSDWVRLRIIENSEINGVRFPKGVVIDVSQEDGDRLLEAGKASYVNEDEINDVKSELKARNEASASNKMEDSSELEGSDSNKLSTEQPNDSGSKEKMGKNDDQESQGDILDENTVETSSEQEDVSVPDETPKDIPSDANNKNLLKSGDQESTVDVKDDTTAESSSEKESELNVDEISSTASAAINSEEIGQDADKEKTVRKNKSKDDSSPEAMLAGFDLDEEKEKEKDSDKSQ